MKNIIHFFMVFIPLLISGFIYKFDPLFYDNLNKPWFTLPKYMFSIIWIILFIIISISVVKCINKTNIIKDRDYFYTLLSNYISIYAYIIMFFNLKSPIFGFIMCIATFISAVFLFKETKRIINKSSFILIPYILWSIYAGILSGFIFFMNF